MIRVDHCFFFFSLQTCISICLSNIKLGMQHKWFDARINSQLPKFRTEVAFLSPCHFPSCQVCLEAKAKKNPY